MRLVGLRRVGTGGLVQTARQRCCPRRRDRVGWDGVAMMTEPEAPPRSKPVPEGRAPQLPRRLVADLSTPATCRGSRSSAGMCVTSSATT